MVGLRIIVDGIVRLVEPMGTSECWFANLEGEDAFGRVITLYGWCEGTNVFSGLQDGMAATLEGVIEELDSGQLSMLVTKASQGQRAEAPPLAGSREPLLPQPAATC